MEKPGHAIEQINAVDNGRERRTAPRYLQFNEPIHERHIKSLRAWEHWQNITKKSTFYALAVLFLAALDASYWFYCCSIKVTPPCALVRTSRMSSSLGYLAECLTRKENYSYRYIREDRTCRLARSDHIGVSKSVMNSFIPGCKHAKCVRGAARGGGAAAREPVGASRDKWVTPQTSCDTNAVVCALILRQKLLLDACQYSGIVSFIVPPYVYQVLSCRYIINFLISSLLVLRILIYIYSNYSFSMTLNSFISILSYLVSIEDR